MKKKKPRVFFWLLGVLGGGDIFHKAPEENDGREGDQEPDNAVCGAYHLLENDGDFWFC